MRLIQGDCLEVMKDIPDKSVDAIIADIPYGTTACKWDSVIPFTYHIKEGKKVLYLADALIKGFSLKYFNENKKPGMWEQLNRLIKPNGAIVLFGSEPFSSALRMSNIKNYKYDWVWNKQKNSNPFLGKVCPTKIHELISVFNNHNYYPIKTELKNTETIKREKRKKSPGHISQHFRVGYHGQTDDLYKYPESILNIKQTRGNNQFLLKNGLHPTQKPLALMEYLIKTYTNELETVLDFTCGSGTTGVACKKLNRQFIGIEKDPDYFKIAQERINQPVERPLF